MSCTRIAHPYIDPETGQYKWVGESGGGGKLPNACNAFDAIAIGSAQSIQFHLELTLPYEGPYQEIWDTYAAGPRSLNTKCIQDPTWGWVSPLPCQGYGPGPWPCHYQSMCYDFGMIPLVVMANSDCVQDPPPPAFEVDVEMLTVYGPPENPCRYFHYYLENAFAFNAGGGVTTGHQLFVRSPLTQCSFYAGITENPVFPYTILNGALSSEYLWGVSIKHFDTSNFFIPRNARLVLDS